MADDDSAPQDERRKAAEALSGWLARNGRGCRSIGQRRTVERIGGACHRPGRGPAESILARGRRSLAQ